MEMAKYILSILRTQLMVVWSWGFNSPIALEKGLRFRVQGFKFRGVVEVLYNEGQDLFDIFFIKRNKMVEYINGVYFDQLVEVIDDYVEKTTNYKEMVEAEYAIKAS